LIDRMMAKERDKRPGKEKEWQELVKPLFKPFKLPKADKPKFGDLPRASDREKTQLSGAAAAARRTPKPMARRRPERPLRRFVLNLLLVLVLAVWIFFNYERIPGMLLWLWRSIVSGISSLIARF
jgi:hypothetical protein